MNEPVGTRDRQILRDLGAQVAEIAARPVQQERIACWKALNGLRPVRPMVMIDQIPWHEMDVDGELTLRTEGDWSRAVETGLRRTLYKWRHMPGDMVVEAALDVGMAIRGGAVGPPVQEQRAVLDPANDVVGHLYLDQIRDEEELHAKLRPPVVSHDEAATAAADARAREVFDGVLEVRVQGMWPVFAAYDRIVTWRSVESVLMDLVDRPDFTHAVIARYTEVCLDLLDQLEAQGLLGRPQSLIHCTGAWSDELPAPGYDPARPRARDLWTYGMAQIFSSVSPAMHKDFWLDYARQWFARFGLVYYGCCEPLHHKVPILRAMPHVRKISMSPFCDVEAGAEAIGGDYVFSRKPSPALLAVETWDPEPVRRDLERTLAVCAAHGCPVELILKDISTVRYQPQRLWEWYRIARELVGEGAVAPEVSAASA